jgi:hypothetical protein
VNIADGWLAQVVGTVAQPPVRSSESVSAPRPRKQATHPKKKVESEGDPIWNEP